jgi:hypothetical protein
VDFVIFFVLVVRRKPPKGESPAKITKLPPYYTDDLNHDVAIHIKISTKNVEEAYRKMKKKRVRFNRFSLCSTVKSKSDGISSSSLLE